MNKKQWQEQDIEKLLNDMPAVKDTRSKDEVFQKLQQAGAFKEQAPVVKPRKNRTPWLVSVAAVAALAVIPAILLNSNNADDKTQYSTADQAEMKDQLESEVATRSLIMASNRNAVYKEDLEHYKALPATQVSEDGVIMPRTVIIPIERIQTDFGTKNPNAIELVEVYEAEIEDLRFVSEAEEKAQSTFYTIIQEQGMKLYVPYNQTYATVTEAMQASMELQQAPFISAIPEGVQFVATEKDQQVTVTFNEVLNLEALALEDAMAMIETLNLTAAAYGFELVLSNVQPMQWEGFDFGQALPQIIGPNRYEITHFAD